MAPPSDGDGEAFRPDSQSCYSIEEVHGCVVVTAAGEIDIATSPGLSDAVRVAGELSPRLIIDLTQATFLDSTGLSVLVHAHTQAHTHGGAVALVSPTGIVRTAIEITGLDKTFPDYASLHEAVAALERPTTPDP